MTVALAKKHESAKQIESALANRFGAAFQRREKRPAEVLPTGVVELDAFLHGIPRGAITEIVGTVSSGRTSLLLSVLAAATRQEETCALVDGSDTFDLLSAKTAQVDFDRLLWVRCNNRLERAFKATDLLLQSGGFGLVVLNLADVAAKHARRIVSSWWFRFRRAVENTPTALLVITPTACVRSCAGMVLEVNNEAAVWLATKSSTLKSSDTRLKNQEHASQNANHLSLVPEPTQPPRRHVSLPAHARLFGGIRVRVNQERPAAWIGGPVKFSAYV
jgi:RecA DNA recombination protein